MIEGAAESPSSWPRRLLAAPTGTSLPPYGYRGLERARRLGAGWLLDEIDASGLRGRGGAGFPTGRKWRTVADQLGSRFVLANGEEGEPAGWKDRYLLRRHPHVVIEGVALAALAVGAAEAWIYLADAIAETVVRSAVTAASDVLQGLVVEVVRVDHTYVAGEETAAVRFLNGGPALPTAKPPRPFESGIRGGPTVVDNVETMAHAAWIAAEGADAFRSVGTEGSPGTFLACVSGSVAAPLLVEVPFGVPLDAIIGAAAPTEDLVGALLGGYFSGFLPAALLPAAADDDVLRPRGFGLGNGAIVAVGTSRCPVLVVGDLLAFFAAESAGQCGPCVKGTAAMRDILTDLRTGAAGPDELERLERYGHSLRGRGACQLLDAAALTVARAFEHFGPYLQKHVGVGCPSCRNAGEADPTGGFAIAADELLP